MTNDEYGKIIRAVKAEVQGAEPGDVRKDFDGATRALPDGSELRFELKGGLWTAQRFVAGKPTSSKSQIGWVEE